MPLRTIFLSNIMEIGIGAFILLFLTSFVMNVGNKCCWRNWDRLLPISNTKNSMDQLGCVTNIDVSSLDTLVTMHIVDDASWIDDNLRSKNFWSIYVVHLECQKIRIWNQTKTKPKPQINVTEYSLSTVRLSIYKWCVSLRPNSRTSFST